MSSRSVGSIRTLVETCGPRIERAEIAADGLFGGAVAVERRGIDPVDAGRDRALQRRDARRLAGVDQDAAGDAAAERDLGDQQPGTA